MELPAANLFRRSHCLRVRMRFSFGPRFDPVLLAALRLFSIVYIRDSRTEMWDSDFFAASIFSSLILVQTGPVLSKLNWLLSLSTVEISLKIFYPKTLEVAPWAGHVPHTCTYAWYTHMSLTHVHMTGTGHL